MTAAPARLRAPRAALALVAAASAGALAVAYISEYLFDLQPCVLCLYQRVPYWAALGLALAALVLGSRPLHGPALALAALAFAIGGAIAVHHVGVEQHWWASVAACAGGQPLPGTVADLQRALTVPAPPPCDAPAWTLFGLSMAGYNGVASFALAIFAFAAANRARKHR